MNLTKESKGTFENWKVNLDLSCLQDELGNEKFIQPRLLKLLAALLDNANGVISKPHLIKQVWDEVIVGEESLSKAIFDLRKFLDENFKNPPRITTIRKVGYKLEFDRHNQKNRVKSTAMKVLKIVIYGIVGFTLLALVLRGLSYEN